jgi:mono/diheme cytochrome c family protein
MVICVAFMFVVACGKNNEPPPPSSGSPTAQPESAPQNHGGANHGDAAARAQAMFNTVCATCHGADGTGNGPAAASLNPKPRNYTDPAWQASVTDDDIRKTILLGGQATGKSPMMPGQPQLKDDPDQLAELVKIIRGFAKK